MNYAIILNKILFDSLPLISYFNIDKHGFKLIPYIHGNALYLNEAREKFAFSAGVGLSFRSEALAVELNYTPFIMKEKVKHGVELSVNFGLD
jgi:hypothetical protein